MAIKRYLLDSNAVNAMSSNHALFMTNLDRAARNGYRIGTCEPIVAELLYGLAMSASHTINFELLQTTLQKLACWPLDRAASKIYGPLAANLRRKGRPMQVFDMMLAAIALSLGDCTVVTTDSDLHAIPDLAIENWELPSPEA